MRKAQTGSADRLVQRLIIGALVTVVLSVICSIAAVKLFTSPAPSSPTTINLPQRAPEKPFLVGFDLRTVVEIGHADNLPKGKTNGICKIAIPGVMEGRRFLADIRTDCELEMVD